MAAIQMLDQIDDTTDSVIESIRDVQNTMSLLHSTVGELLNSMAETLKSMAEMKSALLLQPTTESSSSSSQVTLNHQQVLPAPPTKQSTVVVDNSIDEKEESRLIHLKKVQIEIPVFEGLNVNSWITLAERYFKIGSFTETEKLRLAYLSVEGHALSWFNLWENRKPFLDWNDFKSRLLERFGDLKSGSVMERLLSLKQVDSVVVYLGEFEELASQSLDISDSVLEIVFVKGLKEEIREMLRVFQPKGLKNIITMALRLENSPFCRLMNPPLTDSEFQDLCFRRKKVIS